MPAGSERPPAAGQPRALPSLPHTWRPTGVRYAVIGFGLTLLVVCTAAWFGFDDSVRERFTPLQRLTLAALRSGARARPDNAASLRTAQRPLAELSRYLGSLADSVLHISMGFTDADGD